MLNRITEAIKSVSSQIVAVIGLLSGIVGLLVPAVKEFAVSTPLLGWGLFLGAVVILPVVAKAPATNKKEIARKKDIELLRDRLQGWELDSTFFQYLTQGATHEHLDLSFASNLDKHLDRWEFDAREMKNPEVQRIWKACEAATVQYNERINEHLFLKASAQDFLHVPPEWQWDDPDRYKRAFEELLAARLNLLAAIRNAHRILHGG